MIHPLPFDEALFAAYGTRLGITESDQAARSLAEAIACSPGWDRHPGCSLLVRSAPAAIAIVGDLRPDAVAELSAQADAVRFRSRHFQYVSYDQAEADCARLAAQLRPLLQHEAWKDARFLAIPRGGHLVLGMLATVLDLPRERLLPTSDPVVPVIVVDDCALTGARFREHLAQLSTRQVMFAHLYSHPELREAILAREPRVRECLAAHDLADLPAEAEGPAWWDRLPTETYLRIPSEVACFAWNEPDRVVRNPADGEIVPGWRMIPPALCLKSRQQPSIPVKTQEPGAGPFRPGPDVFFTGAGEDVFVTSASIGFILRLEGLAAAAWRAVLRTGDPAVAEAELAEQFEVDREVLRLDLQRVLSELTGLALLRG